MAAEAVHVAIGRRNATVAHDDGDLVQRFRQRGPEIPVALRAARAGRRNVLVVDDRAAAGVVVSSFLSPMARSYSVHGVQIHNV